MRRSTVISTDHLRKQNCTHGRASFIVIVFAVVLLDKESSHSCVACPPPSPFRSTAKRLRSSYNRSLLLSSDLSLLPLDLHQTHQRSGTRSKVNTRLDQGRQLSCMRFGRLQSVRETQPRIWLGEHVFKMTEGRSSRGTRLSGSSSSFSSAGG